MTRQNAARLQRLEKLEAIQESVDTRPFVMFMSDHRARHDEDFDMLVMMGATPAQRQQLRTDEYHLDRLARNMWRCVFLALDDFNILDRCEAEQASIWETHGVPLTERQKALLVTYHERLSYHGGDRPRKAMLEIFDGDEALVAGYCSACQDRIYAKAERGEALTASEYNAGGYNSRLWRWKDTLPPEANARLLESTDTPEHYLATVAELLEQYPEQVTE